MLIDGVDGCMQGDRNPSRGQGVVLVIEITRWPCARRIASDDYGCALGNFDQMFHVIMSLH